jgi:ferrous iron transport protein B
MNRLMNKVGLSGKSFIPLILGFGCNVPAILATRTLRSQRERVLTILINPFMSCSARLVVYLLLVEIFFEKYKALIILSLYLLGIVIAFVSALILKKAFFKNKASNFIIEFPHYRIPRLKNALINMWKKGFEFIKSAGSIIFTVVIVIWFLANMPYGVEYASQDSIIGIIGTSIAPIFEPLGFGNWQSSVALIFGFLAKEVVVGIFGSLYGVAQEGLSTVLLNVFTPLSAYAFMVFTLLYIPCMATIAVIRRETGSWRWTLFSVFYSTTTAYIITFIFYQGGKLLGFS